MKEEKWFNRYHPQGKNFRGEDIEKGPIVKDSDFGYVIHVNSSCCILPDGTKIYEW